jgi:hypothetical protein
MAEQVSTMMALPMDRPCRRSVIGYKVWVDTDGQYRGSV